MEDHDYKSDLMRISWESEEEDENEGIGKNFNKLKEKEQLYDAVIDSGFDKELAHQFPFVLSTGFENSIAQTTSSEWINHRLNMALEIILNHVDINSSIRGGIPVVKGTKISISQIISELGDDNKISEIAEDFDLVKDDLMEIINAIATYLDRPYQK